MKGVTPSDSEHSPLPIIPVLRPITYSGSLLKLLISDVFSWTKLVTSWWTQLAFNSQRVPLRNWWRSKQSWKESDYWLYICQADRNMAPNERRCGSVTGYGYCWLECSPYQLYKGMTYFSNDVALCIIWLMKEKLHLIWEIRTTKNMSYKQITEIVLVNSMI